MRRISNSITFSLFLLQFVSLNSLAWPCFDTWMTSCCTTLHFKIRGGLQLMCVWMLTLGQTLYCLWTGVVFVSLQYMCSSKKGLKLILSTQTYDVALQSTTAACMHLSVGHFWLWFLMQLRAKRLSGREWRQQGFAWFQYRDMCKSCLCSPSSCPHEEILWITVL